MDRKRILVVAAVIRDGGRILLARRPQHVHQGGLWEFPGGKVELDETEPQALARELHEELGITPRQMLPLIRISHDYPDKSVTLSVWEIAAFDGHEAVSGPLGREGQEIAWHQPASLRTLSFPAANVPIVAAATLPRGWCITPPLETPDAVRAWARARLPSGEVATPAGHGWLLRLPGWSERDYMAIATELLMLSRPHGLPLLLHGHPARLQALPLAAGIHVPATLARDLPLSGEGWRAALLPEHWLSLAAHDAGELARAKALGATCALLSPCRATASHPGQTPLGDEAWAALVTPAALPVYALGGMTPADHDTVRHLGGQGVAGIRGF